MEEAIQILWTYARREPINCNGKTVVPTVNNSIAAIRIIARLEGWFQKSENRRGNSEERNGKNEKSIEPFNYENTHKKENNHLSKDIELTHKYNEINKENNTIAPKIVENTAVEPIKKTTTPKNYENYKNKNRKKSSYKSFRFRKCKEHSFKHSFLHTHTPNLYSKSHLTNAYTYHTAPTALTYSSKPTCLHELPP